MTVTCSRDLWTSALALLKHATLANGSMPVLAEIEVSASDGRVRLSGTDLMVEMSVALVGDGSLKPCPVSLATITKLTKASKRARGQELSLSNTESGLRLEIAGRTFEIESGQSDRPEGWSHLDWSAGSAQSHGGAEFYDALTYCAPAASRDPTREHLCGVYLGDNHMVTTDGHRAHVARHIESFPGSPVTLPSSAAAALRAAIKASDAPWIMARQRSGSPPMVQFHVEGVLLESLITVRGIEAQFPPWREVCPDYDLSFSVESDLWVASLATAGKLAGTAGAWIAVHKECRVQLEGLFSEVLPLSQRPRAAAKMCANPHYLLDASAGAGELVHIEYSGGKDLDPVVVRPNDRHFGVVMPMRG